MYSPPSLWTLEMFLIAPAQFFWTSSTSASVTGAGPALEYGTEEWCRKMRTLPSSHFLYPKVYSTVVVEPSVASVKSYVPIAMAVLPFKSMLWLLKTTSDQPLPPLIANPPSSSMPSSTFFDPTKYDIALAPDGRKRSSRALVGLKSTFEYS